MNVGETMGWGWWSRRPTLKKSRSTSRGLIIRWATRRTTQRVLNTHSHRTQPLLQCAHSWHRATSQTRQPAIPQTPTRAPTRPQLPPGVKPTSTHVIYGGNSCKVHIFPLTKRTWLPWFMGSIDTQEPGEGHGGVQGSWRPLGAVFSHRDP